ncbi:ferritin family protein [Chloroflexota bacterium]
MSVLFSSGELINIAIGIERNGAAFYESLAKEGRDAKSRDTYEYLADMEREHIKIFSKMLDSMGTFNLPESYTEEYDLYLKSLVGSAIFTDDKVAREMAQKVADSAEAIQIGIVAEKDSILFYSEMQHLVPERERKLVNNIIDEEKSHLRQLSDLKKELTKGG